MGFRPWNSALSRIRSVGASTCAYGTPRRKNPSNARNINSPAAAAASAVNATAIHAATGDRFEPKPLDDERDTREESGPLRAFQPVAEASRLGEPREVDALERAREDEKREGEKQGQAARDESRGRVRRDRRTAGRVARRGRAREHHQRQHENGQRAERQDHGDADAAEPLEFVLGRIIDDRLRLPFLLSLLLAVIRRVVVFVVARRRVDGRCGLEFGLRAGGGSRLLCFVFLPHFATQPDDPSADEQDDGTQERKQPERQERRRLQPVVRDEHDRGESEARPRSGEERRLVLRGSDETRSDRTRIDRRRRIRHTGQQFGRFGYRGVCARTWRSTWKVPSL